MIRMLLPLAGTGPLVRCPVAIPAVAVLRQLHAAMQHEKSQESPAPADVRSGVSPGSVCAIPPRPRTRLALVVPAVLALLSPAAGARAHALVVASEPSAGARLAEPPGRVTIRFNSRIDPERSRLSLTPADSRPGAPVAAPLPLEILPSTDRTVIEAVAPPLPPGAWRLRWQVLAVDGHITRGDIPFSIGPAAR
jgi:hypothetical protein